MFAFLSELRFDSRAMSTNKVIQLIDEQPPRIVLLEIRGEINAKMLSSEGKSEAKSIAHNHSCLFLRGVPFVVLNGISRYTQ